MDIKKISNPTFLFTVIVILFLVTRFYKISEIPVSVYWDEASIGYNAYSIAQTGMDEWGDFFPLHFRAFGEFKLPVYIYAVVPFVKIFGLNIFSIRFPAVLFSLGILVLTYFLSKKISGNIRVGLFSIFLLTISPWFFIFSRTGYEATAGLMFYLLGTYLFLFYKKSWGIFFSILSFILSFYSYNSFRILIPICLVILTIAEWRSLKHVKIIPAILAVLILFLSMIPVYRLYKYDSGSSRFLSVASKPRELLKNYFSHFTPKFLLISGDLNLRSQQSGLGQLYFSDVVFLLMGIIYLVRNRSKYGWLALIFMLLSPIPAAITKESPHSLRSISIVPFISIISAMSIIWFERWNKKIFLFLFMIAVSLYFFTNYFLSFINIYPTESSKDWQYGYSRVFTDYKNKFLEYDHIIISDEYAQPYIFALFYQKIDPNQFSSTVTRASVDRWGFSTVASFDKFIFSKINLANLPTGKNLIFASVNEKQTGISNYNKILNPDYSISFYVYEYIKK